MSAIGVLSTGEVVRLPLDSLYGGPEVRRERHDLDHVAALVEGDGAWPPISVCRSTHGRPYRVLDGHHRLAAAGRLGRTDIAAVVFDVGANSPEALELAASANIEHGKPLTLDERKSIAGRLIKDTEFSDARIAAACGLSHQTVGRLRPRDRATCPEDQLRGTVGRDNKVRPNPVVAAERRQAAAREVQEKPTASDREIALRIGLSPRTVADVRRRNEAGEDAVPPRLRAVPDPVPEPEGPPSVAVRDIVTLVPIHWAQEKACQRSNDAREFGRFMDRFTLWRDKSFEHWVKTAGEDCPADLRAEAALQAKWMAGWWRDYAAALAAPIAPKEVG